MGARGLAVTNIDATVVAEAPRLAEHLAKMEAAISDVLGLPNDAVNVKATSTDGLGAVGRGEGIAAFAVALLADAEGKG